MKYWPIGLTAIFAIPLFVSFGTGGLSSRTQDFSIARSDPARSVPVVMKVSAGSEGFRSHHVSMRLKNTSLFLVAESIFVQIGTYQGRPKLHKAKLTFDGLGCGFTSKQGFIEDNQFLELGRDPDCDLRGIHSSPVMVRLEVIAESERLALWTREFRSRSTHDVLVIDRKSRRPAHPVLRVLYSAKTPHSFTKADLLATMWDWSGTRPLYFALLFGFIITASGLWGIKRSQNRRVQPASWVLPMGVSLLAGGISLVYAVVSPPFQAPDEPDHFLSFVRSVDKPELGDDALSLANLGHFERIKFRNQEKFTAGDVDVPLDYGRWSKHIAPADYSKRAPLVHWSWIAWDRLISPASASSALLMLRLSGCALFMLAMAFSCVIFQKTFDSTSEALIASYPPILVPAIAFFAMNVSNYTFLVPIIILQITCMIHMLWSRRLNTGVLVVMSLLMVSACLVSRLGFTLLPFWILICSIILVHRARLDGLPWSSTIIRLVTLLAPLVCFGILAAIFFHAEIWSLISSTIERVYRITPKRSLESNQIASTVILVLLGTCLFVWLKMLSLKESVYKKSNPPIKPITHIQIMASNRPDPLMAKKKIPNTPPTIAKS